MPKYTARVYILKDKKIDDEIWFEGFHAKGQEQADEIVNKQSIAYVSHQRGGSGITYGFKVDLCMRTAILDDKQKLAKKDGIIIPLEAGARKEKEERAAARSEKARLKNLVTVVDYEIKARNDAYQAARPKTQSVTLKINSKFKSEERGSFDDVINFKHAISIQVLW